MRGRFTNDVIHRAIMRVEDECAVEEWRVGDLQIWPLVKVILSADLSNFGRQFSRVEGAGSLPLTHRFPIAPLLDIARTRSRDVMSKLRHPDARTDLHRADAFLYGDGASYVRVEGRYFDRLLDPLAMLLRRRGLSSCFATPSSGFHSPRTSPTYFVQPRLNHARVLARLRVALHRPSLVGPDVERALGMLRDELPGAPVQSAEYYASLGVYVESYQEEFERMLDVVRPTLVFVVGYYGTEAMGLIRAAHRRGSVAVDVQHGLVTANHVAYSGSKRLPAMGSDLQPHAFWIYGEDEAAVIRKWTQQRPGAPEPVMGGNLLLEAWREGTLPWMSADLERMRKLRAGLGNVKHAVYTLQGFETPETLAELASLARRTRGSVYWWFRLHPANPAGRSAIEAAFASAGADNAVVQASTDVPLYAVLRDADVHVTKYSASVAEAAAFGVPSVLTSKEESTFFPRELAEGWAVVAEGPDAIVDAIAAQIAAAPALQAAAAARRAVDPEAALDQLQSLQRRLHDRTYRARIQEKSSARAVDHERHT